MLFYLTAQGLQNINKELFQSDFSIEFNNFNYKCPSLLAEFISPKIKLLRKQNSSVNSFKIDMSLKHAEKSIYQLEKLMYGFSIPLSDSQENEDEILSILFSLGNIEVFNTETFKNITKDNVKSLLRLKKNNKADYQSEIDFLANYFYEFIDDLKTLEVDDLSRILSSSNLTLESEYSLFTFIKDMISINQSYTPLLLYLKPEFIPPNALEELVSVIDTLNESYISTLWPMLRKHYINGYSKYSPSRHLGIVIPYNESAPWNGLFAYYKNYYHSDNIVKGGQVSIKSSSHGSGNLQYIINSDDNFETSNNQNEWILINIPHYFCLKNYRIQTTQSFNDNLRSWVIECKNEKDEWVTIDERKDDFSLVDRNQAQLFNVSSYSFYKTFRLRQTDVNHANSHFLSIGRIEFYGFLRTITE